MKQITQFLYDGLKFLGFFCFAILLSTVFLMLFLVLIGLFAGVITELAIRTYMEPGIGVVTLDVFVLIVLLFLAKNQRIRRSVKDTWKQIRNGL